MKEYRVYFLSDQTVDQLCDACTSCGNIKAKNELLKQKEQSVNAPKPGGSLPIDELRSKLLSMRFSKEEMRAADNEKALEIYGFTDCINNLLEWLQPKRQ